MKLFLSKAFTAHRVGVLFILLTGCGLQSQQEIEYDAMRKAGYEVKEKSSGAAIGLGFLLGGGSFYTRQYGWGVADLLLWPSSILWDPFLGYNESKVINYMATKSHVDTLMKNEIEIHYALFINKQISIEQFNLKKYEIERKYDFTQPRPVQTAQTTQEQPEKVLEPKQKGYFE